MEKKYLPEVIEGTRIVLKKSTVAMAEEAMRITISHPDRFNWLRNREKPWTIENEINGHRFFEESWRKQEGFDWSIFLKENGRLIGGIGTPNLDFAAETTELGFWLGAEYEGKGLASEAVLLVMDMLKKQGFKGVGGRPTNDRSKALFLRNGFVLVKDGAVTGPYENLRLYWKDL